MWPGQAVTRVDPFYPFCRKQERLFLGRTGVLTRVVPFYLFYREQARPFVDRTGCPIQRDVSYCLSTGKQERLWTG